MRDVSAVDLGVTVVGQRLEIPILLAPSAFHKLVHPDGELASAGAPTPWAPAWSLDAVQHAAGGRRRRRAAVFLQRQIHKDRGLTTSLQERAEAAGYKGLVRRSTPPTTASGRPTSATTSGCRARCRSRISRTASTCPGAGRT